jgi:tetratricopeptide (TPR) repeat protein
MDRTCCTLDLIADILRRPRGRLTGLDVDAGLIRRTRLEAGLSLAQVAGRELTRQAVHLVETGKTRPSRRTLQIIARRLGVPLTAFLAGSERDEAPITDARAGELERLCQAHQLAQVIELGTKTLERSASPSVRAAAHFYTGQALVRLTRADDALAHLTKAQELFESLDDPWFVAESMDWISGALYIKEDPRALALAEEALARYRALEPRLPATEARILEHIGVNLAKQHAYERARWYYEEAVRVAGDVRDLARMARIYHGLSMCYEHLGDLGRATEFAHKALALFSLEHDQGLVGRLENDLGLLFMRQNQFDRADELLAAALRHVAGGDSERLRSHVLLSVAELRMLKGRINESFALVRQAIVLAEQVGEVSSVVSGFQQLGELHAQRGEHALVDESFARAVDIAAEAMLVERREECLSAWAVLRESRGRPAEAQGVPSATS